MPKRRKPRRLKPEEEAALIRQLLADMSMESDWGTAIIGAGFLDDMLYFILEAYLVDDTGVKQLLKNDLDTFAMRTKMCFALGLFGKQLRDALDGVRDIRNQFAHEWATLSFDTPPISDMARSLPFGTNDIGPDDIRQAIEAVKSAGKKRFIKTVLAADTCLRMLETQIDRRKSSKGVSTEAWKALHPLPGEKGSAPV